MAFSHRAWFHKADSPARSVSSAAHRGPGASAFDSGHDDETFDVEFLAPTARLPSGIVCKPRSIPANSTRLKELCPYFNTLLSRAQDNRGSRWIPDYRDVYGDSDLEDVKDCGSTQIEDWAAKYAFGPGIRRKRGQHRVIILQDIAATTLEAVILFLYTGKLYYELVNSRPSLVTSARSLYRAADKMGIESLKREVMAAMISQIRRDDIVDALFSKSVSNHPDLIERLVRRLLAEVWDQTTQERLQEKIVGIVRGDMPYAGAALQQLLSHITRIGVPHFSGTVTSSPLRSGTSRAIPANTATGPTPVVQPRSRRSTIARSSGNTAPSRL